MMQLFNNLRKTVAALHRQRRRPAYFRRTTRQIIILTFADSAPGVSDEQLQKAFDRFYRTGVSRNRASGGSELGLAICVNIVRA